MFRIYHQIRKALRPLFPTFAIVFLIVNLLFWASYLLFKNKIYPNVAISGVTVGNMTKDQAEKLLESSFSAPTEIKLVSSDDNFSIKLSDIDFRYDHKNSIDMAYNLYRNQNPLINIYSSLLFVLNNQNLEIRYSYDREKLDQLIQVIDSQISIDPVYPEVKIDSTNFLTYENGRAGKSLNKGLLISRINDLAENNFEGEISLSFNEINPEISNEEAEKLILRANRLLDKKIKIYFKDGKIEKQFTLDNKHTIPFLKPNSDFYQDRVGKFTDEIALEIERQPENPVFVFEDNRVKEFSPAVNGVKVNKEVLNSEIINALKYLETSSDKEKNLDITYESTKPPISTSQVNNLGINELLGIGESRFKGSIPSRVHNVSLASSRLNGLLIPPGETFSFNQNLGDVSAFTGYKQAYIIRDGKTILGDGGGVCQVSTTLFRAILNAGLPIVERSPHSYRVSYYEQGFPPGLDATVYAPSPDLKFKNDTPNHLLIQTKIDPANYYLAFEIYGTSDGRIATTTKPQIINSITPPEDLYVDDPTLPAGQIKQIEHKAYGAKVVFDYKVERNGEEIFAKTFTSNYKAWQAVYLRGTGPSI